MGRATLTGLLTDKKSRGKGKRRGGYEMARLTLTTLLAAGLILITAAVAGAEEEYYVPGEVLAKCTVVLEVDYGSGVPQTGDEQLDAVIIELGVYEIPEIYDLLPEEPIDDPNGKWDWDDWQDMMDEEQLDTFYTFKYSSDTNPIAAAEMLAACDIVEIAEPNYLLELEVSPITEITDFIPNDVDFWRQWNFHNTGQTGGTPDADIDAPEGWEYWFPKYPFRTSFVGVVDSGVGLYHPDLVGNIGPGYNVYEEGSPPQDIHGHGTHIAGIISAVTNNAIGVAGIGFNAIKVMPIKISNWDEEEGFNERVASKGIMWGAQNGADVENFSWHVPGEYYPAILHRFIRSAYKIGVVMCASAGNESEWTGEGNPHYPSTFKEVITVTATDPDDVFVAIPKWPWGSNYGPDTEFSAPGAVIWSTYINGDYKLMGGTSMAAPHISAAAALIQAHYWFVVDPPMDRVASARYILQNSVDDLWPPGWDERHRPPPLLPLPRGEGWGEGLPPRAPPKEPSP